MEKTVKTVTRNQLDELNYEARIARRPRFPGGRESWIPDDVIDSLVEPILLVNQKIGRRKGHLFYRCRIADARGISAGITIREEDFERLKS